MQTRLTIEELWPLSDEEAAQKIGAFLRELQIEKRTGGTSQDLLPLVQEALSWETGKQKLKEQLLEKYAQKEPNTFYQFDGWADQPPDDFMIRDEEGDVKIASETEELMSTCPDVRVLIPPGTDREHASRLLKKIAGWIEGGYAQEIQREDPLGLASL